MGFLLHDSALGAAKCLVESVYTLVSHWYLFVPVLINLRLLLWVDAVDRGTRRVHLLFHTCRFASESVRVLETVHMLIFLVFVNVLLFHFLLFVERFFLSKMLIMDRVMQFV